MIKPSKVLVAAVASIAVIAMLHRNALAEAGSADVEMESTARLVTVDGAPHFTAKGSGAIEYERSDGETASISGSAIPSMVYESDDPPNGLDALTVIVGGTIGTTATADWSEFPRVVLENLILHVAVYDAPAEKAGGGVRPIIEFTLPPTELSTDRIVVEGVESGGYIDLKKMEAQLAGKIVLPDADFDPYSEHLAGEPIIFELLIRLMNNPSPLSAHRGHVLRINTSGS